MEKVDGNDHASISSRFGLIIPLCMVYVGREVGLEAFKMKNRQWESQYPESVRGYIQHRDCRKSRLGQTGIDRKPEKTSRDRRKHCKEIHHDTRRNTESPFKLPLSVALVVEVRRQLIGVQNTNSKILLGYR